MLLLWWLVGAQAVDEQGVAPDAALTYAAVRAMLAAGLRPDAASCLHRAAHAVRHHRASVKRAFHRLAAAAAAGGAADQRDGQEPRPDGEQGGDAEAAVRLTDLVQVCAHVCFASMLEPVAGTRT